MRRVDAAGDVTGQMPLSSVATMQGRKIAEQVCRENDVDPAIFSLVVANSIDLEAIAIIGSAGFLTLFAVVNAASFRLSSRIGSRTDACKARWPRSRWTRSPVASVAISASLSPAKETLPMGAWTMPAFSTRNSTAPPLEAATAAATSGVSASHDW